MPPVDPNEVMMTGENSFIRLSPDGGKTLSDRASHWRVLWCPAGGGHVLFLQSTLTDARVKIYSDNIAVARWLQKPIESLLFPAFADTSLPVVSARSFERDGGPWSTATETVHRRRARSRCPGTTASSPSCSMRLPASTTGRSACSAPSSRRASAQLEMNGKVAPGSVWAEMRGDRQGSSARSRGRRTWT